ncbi:MAG: hypothetical protein FJY85_11750, partial [Deltaproteobacteria bacterium]|nr:hypothetical protein [Deltaproteobacteria bacterium]
MKNPDRSDSAEHPKEFLLPYVEDLLPVEERTVMDQHLRSCQECSREVTELDYIIGTLRTHKEVFCPDPWLLQDYVDLGQDPGDRISEHLKECASCSEELSHVKSSPAESIMPPRVREAFEEHYASGPAPLREAVTVSVFSVLYGYLSDLFRLPVLA